MFKFKVMELILQSKIYYKESESKYIWLLWVKLKCNSFSKLGIVFIKNASSHILKFKTDLAIHIFYNIAT